MRSPLAVIAPVHPNNYSPGRTWTQFVDVIVIHVTEGSAASVKSWFNNPEAVVSAHYMVQRDGTIISFVDENDRAYHAGQLVTPSAALVRDRYAAGKWTPNSYGIGIEHEGDGTTELTVAQRAASQALILDILTRHPVPLDREHILGHHEIKASKTCPGAISVDRLVAELAERAAPAPVSLPNAVVSPTLGLLIPMSADDDAHWQYTTVAEIRASNARRFTAGAPLSQFPILSEESAP